MFSRLLLTLIFVSCVGADLIEDICKRNMSQAICKNSGGDLRKAPAEKPIDPFKKKFEPTSVEEEEDISLEDENEVATTRRPIIRTTVKPPRQNILYTIYPTLQKEKDWRKYCPVNQYTFQVTCLPGKKLRYDLQVFCQQFSEMCGVPNTNLYPNRFSNPADEGRPTGYGQKQKNGNFGVGRSWGFGIGAIPGFEVRTSQGADIGQEKLPFFNQIGGMMLNTGGEVGVLGHRTGKGPARSMNALTHGFPSFGLGAPNDGDQKFAQETLKSLGVPNVPGLNNVFKKLGQNKPNKRITGYEPGYGAVNPNAPFAIGKTDVDDLNLPASFGAIEVIRGSGMGIGK
ncbi:unnamed protein product [Caenorhabditis auriculariae]|uniref:Uncharacterized protein n=1 Tax=Caenorhabditis auriculariae TaxID=2777116 RepID=A0A8S1H6F3_9PELO|nr:unnamed protein product [Caenorhabditis auriculariae]